MASQYIQYGGDSKLLFKGFTHTGVTVKLRTTMLTVVALEGVKKGAAA